MEDDECKCSACKPDWRFEPDTYLVQAFEAHWDAPGVVCKHSDTYECARTILEWLGEVNVELVRREPG